MDTTTSPIDAIAAHLSAAEGIATSLKIPFHRLIAQAGHRDFRERATFLVRERLIGRAGYAAGLAGAARAAPVRDRDCARAWERGYDEGAHERECRRWSQIFLKGWDSGDVPLVAACDPDFASPEFRDGAASYASWVAAHDPDLIKPGSPVLFQGECWTVQAITDREDESAIHSITWDEVDFYDDSAFVSLTPCNPHRMAPPCIGRSVTPSQVEPPRGCETKGTEP